MESHILNSYHQARYRIIGQVVRSTSNSISSEGSNQNSPEYPQSVNYNRSFEESNDGEYWDQDRKTAWNQNHLANAAEINTCSSDEEDVSIEVQEVTVDEKEPEINSSQYSETDNVEDNSLIEGDDYDVIQVYAVHPDLDLEEASTDDETQNSDDENVAVESCSVDSQGTKENDARKKSISYDDGLNFNLDTPVVSNVDEYFIKAEKKQDNILEIKDGPIVYDVDEFFIKDPKKVPNVDEFLVKTKLPKDDSSTSELKEIANVDEFIVKTKPTPDEAVKYKILPDTPIHSQVPVIETDLEVIPKIEELKKFLLDETLSYSKFKNLQRSCSVPHSPLHICMDIEDAKTCLSFEDLNLDLSDLAAFDTDKSMSSANKSEDPPQTLTEEDVNSFLITDQKLKQAKVIQNEDDFNPQDMELDCPIESLITHAPIIKTPTKDFTSTPEKAKVKQSVLDFCIEKPETKVIKKELVENEDFVDVESCNDTIIPVLAANNLNSLLEQFEANEKLNIKKKHAIKIEDPKVVKNTQTNGTRLQDAGVQLNKNKMRHILMPTTINATIMRSPSPVHSDHDYCSSKKRHSLPNLKGGQSLLKPEVLSSNNRILNSRHRSCKNKKVVYHLSSDDESEKSNGKNKTLPTSKNIDLSENKVKKLNVKAMIKPPEPPNCRKKNPVKLSTSEPNTNKYKSNNSVILKTASKASDTPSSQHQNVSIKLTIKNKCEVILNNCDEKDSQKNRCIRKDNKSSVSAKIQEKTEPTKPKSETLIKSRNEILKVMKTENVKTKHSLDSYKNNSVIVKNEQAANFVKEIKIKEENRPTAEFYNALFSNKLDVQLPTLVEVKREKRSIEAEIKAEITDIGKTVEQPQKKKKLNLQEYKMRKCANSASSSAAVSPEAIFPEMPNQCNAIKPLVHQNPTENTKNNTAHINSVQEPRKIFDPIREASRKILAMTKKSKAEAIRKRDEDIVMSKIPKVENLELQPLISDAEMMKIVGMANGEMLPIKTEKPQIPSDYEEIILVSVGTNTDENVFKELAKQNKPSADEEKIKLPIPPADGKAAINFKIKKNDNVLKHNVFDKRRNPGNESKHDTKINKERYKDITATLETVGKQVDNKILSNSLFSSIQDVVMKKAPEKNQNINYTSSDKQKRHCKTVIVREYDSKADHGEDKIILHLGKYRAKPDSASITVQTEQNPELIDSPSPPGSTNLQTKLARKRTESDMSMSSEGSPVQLQKSPKNKVSSQKYKDEVRHESDKRARSKDRRSRSRDRYNRYRSTSRSRRRRKSYSRSRSRSHGRFRRYRRSDSPYKRKRRSRSPYRSRHRSRSRRSDTRPKSRLDKYQTKSPVSKIKPKPSPSKIDDIKAEEPMTPPLRKSTVSESSETSTSSSSSSSSNDSRISRRSLTSKRSRSRSVTPKSRRSTSQKSGDSSNSKRRSLTPRKRSGSLVRRSCSPYSDVYKKKGFRSAYSSEDRESNTPVEERRIVFVGKLEKDITKSALRAKFTKFGPVVEVRLHTKDDGTRYGFVTFAHARDAWRTVEAAACFPQYDVGFGGRRAFCRHSYADLDGLEARYTESVFHGQAPIAPPQRNNGLTFEQMLLEMKNKLSQRKGDKKSHADSDV